MFSHSIFISMFGAMSFASVQFFLARNDMFAAAQRLAQSGMVRQGTSASDFLFLFMSSSFSITAAAPVIPVAVVAAAASVAAAS